MTIKHDNGCLDILEDMAITVCTTADGKLDSMAVGSYADALRLLAHHGRVVIERDALYGRRVVARRCESATAAGVGV